MHLVNQANGSNDGNSGDASNNGDVFVSSLKMLQF
jgi:hypothetical protein